MIKNIIIMLFFVLLLVMGFAYVKTTQNLKKQITINKTQSLFYQNYKKDCENTNYVLNKDLNNCLETNQNLYNQVIDLNKENAKIYNAYVDLNSKTFALNNYNSELKKDIQKTLEDIKIYKTDIINAINWYKSNATFENTNLKRVKEYAKQCLKKTNSCEINLGCLSYINNAKLGLKYESDIKAIGKKDNIQAIDEFYKSKKGDCEDFSLFVRAEINYLKSICKNKTIKYNTFINKRGNKFFIYKNWYYNNAKAKTIFGKNAYVICGLIPDTKNQKLGGHCVIGLSNKTLNNVSDLNNFNPILFEPQSGLYLGTLNEVAPLINTNTNRQNPFVDNIITNDDFYLYSFIKKKWFTNKHFLSVLEKESKTLEEVTK